MKLSFLFWGLHLGCSYVAHNIWTDIGKMRSDCWPAVGNVRFANRAPTNHLPIMASGWASANLSFVYQPSTPQQWPNKIIFFWSISILKLLGLRWLITGMTTHLFPTVSTIYQWWPNCLCYLGKEQPESFLSFFLCSSLHKHVRKIL